MTSPAPTDPRPALQRAIEIADAVQGTVGPDHLDRPTPCAEFDVRTLRGHLLTVIRRVAIVLSGGRFDAVPHVTVVADEDYDRQWATGREELLAVLPGVDLGRTVIAPFGTVPAGAAIGSYIGEFLVHSWDLVAVTGRVDLLDQELAAAVLDVARQRIPAEGRENIPFGPVVDVPVDAPATDRLAAWMGHDPAWAARV
ncbi:TIGR03086 family protein [Nakamurella flava]|uniref:TIGR03086 family protein n=1 Tax=Nakamurella flava TaxID=2576308 RepID=A0A4U6Q715_9ACTN|nr:TIGR03086 family metal-binding protein [Nakamurella flava]TKV56140.1 TIGR03086 family protein [Nakamurella flava]